jgi:hypothetical protein
MDVALMVPYCAPPLPPLPQSFLIPRCNESLTSMLYLLSCLLFSLHFRLCLLQHIKRRDYDKCCMGTIIVCLQINVTCLMTH